MAMERSTVVSVFHDRSTAERAIDELHRLGFRDDEIGFVARDGEGTGGTTTVDRGADDASDAGTGAMSGAIAGAGIGGLIAAAAAMLIPGFGPVVAGGILATVLGGAAVGAAAGGIIGALVGMGVPEDEAEYYQSEFEEGRIIVTVKAGNRYAEARDVLHRFGGYDVEHRPGTTATATSDGTRTATGAGATVPTGSASDQDRLELREERLETHTERAQTGEVTVGKDVVTERREMDVPVRREEVTIERHPVDQRPASGPIREGEEIRVPVHEERVEVEKQPVVYEEVQINTQQVHDTEHVAADVRREEARIDRSGDVNVRGWNDVMGDYRQRWQTRYGSTGGRWEDYEPGYRYGYEMGSDPRYQGRDWAAIEPELRRDYRGWADQRGYRYEENAWDRFKDAARESWEGARSRRAA